MSWLKKYASSQVGQKQLMAICGLGLSLFLLVHLAGNSLLLVGGTAFNEYANALAHLAHSSFVWVARAGMITIFGLHVILATLVTLENRKARAVPYKKKLYRNGEGTIMSGNMYITGFTILVFVIFHLMAFTLAEHTGSIVGTTHIPDPLTNGTDLFLMVSTAFTKEVYLVGYVISVLFVGLHVYHGFASSFQTLGLRNPKYFGLIQKASMTLGILFFVGFASFPILGYLGHLPL